MFPSAPRVCSEHGGQKPVLSLSLDRIGAVGTKFSESLIRMQKFWAKKMDHFFFLQHVIILPRGQQGKDICYGTSEDWVKFKDKWMKKAEILPFYLLNTSTFQDSNWTVALNLFRSYIKWLKALPAIVHWQRCSKLPLPVQSYPL